MKHSKIIWILLFFVGLISCKAKDDVVEKKKPKTPFRETFHQAIQEKMKGNYDLSIELFQKCLGYNDNSDAVHFALSDAYEQTGKDERSLEHALRAYEIDSDNRWYQLRLADLYFKKGDYHKSAKYYELAISAEKNLDVKFKYAEALIYSRQYEKAIDLLNEIEVETGKMPNLTLTKHDMYLEMGKPSEAYQELEDLINDDPNNIENRVVIADYFMRTNQEPKAEKIAKDALEIAPNNGELHLIMADLELRKGHLGESFKHLDKGFRQADVPLSTKVQLIGSLQQYAFEDSDDGRTIEAGLESLYDLIYDEEAKNDTLHQQYGYFLQMQNKPLDAIKQYQLVVSINPNNYDSWMQLIYSQFNIEDYEGMYKSAQEATELFPEQPTVWMMAGISAYESRHFDESEEFLVYGESIVVNDPAMSSEFVHQRGKLAWKRGDYDEAHKYFDEAKTIDQFNGNVYHSKALCLVDQGKIDAALKEADKAIEQAPKNAFFHDLKGLVYFKAGKYKEAKEAFESGLSYETSNAKITEHLGDALFKLGEETKAVEKWKSAMDMGGYNAVLKKKIADERYYEK